MRKLHTGRSCAHWLRLCFVTALLAGSVTAAEPQISKSAYRVLGQTDLRQNGVNMVNDQSLSSPSGVAVDAEGHLYAADTSNHRVLAWAGAASFQNGAAAKLVLGQPAAQRSGQMGIGVKGFRFPLGLAVDPVTGNLYVADYANNRVLRFPKPFANPTRVEPDAVYGQPDFNTFTANTGGVTAQSMKLPRAIAIDRHGNLWVADSGNQRVLRFPAASLETPRPAADLVIGQTNFTTNTANHGAPVSSSGLDAPSGLALDQQDNLFVADLNNRRVLKFTAPSTNGPAAAVVFGQANFISRVIPQVPSAAFMSGPAGLSLDSAGNLLVAVPTENRTLVFAADGVSGAAAKEVFGQPNFTSVTPDTGAFPQASATVMAAPADVKADALGNIFIADANNNRVLMFPTGSKTAARVLGQADFTANGANRIKPGSINSPYKIAVDYSQSPYALYVSDANNSRVLVWKDGARFRTGNTPDLVIGQPGFLTAIPNVDSGGKSTPSATGLAGPRGIAVAADGTLYVADGANNRVLRYPRPVDQTGRITPDAVLGQANFTSSSSAAVTAATLHTPSGLAIGPDGNLFVSDSGNHRVLEFSVGAGTGASAIRVYGQPSFFTGAAPGAHSALTVSSPQGLAVDAASNLFVADSGASRVVVYPNTHDAPASGHAASIVIGQKGFDTATHAATASGLNVPLDLALDGSGNIYVSDTGNNRVVVFPSLLTLPGAGGSATLVIGQRTLLSSVPNYNSTDGMATPEGLASPQAIFVDRRDTVYVGDSGNNRVVHFLKSVSVVNGAYFVAAVPVGRGSWASLFGDGLSTDTQGINSGTLPTVAAGREVAVNDELTTHMYLASPKQFNFFVPTAAPLGEQRISVRVADSGELVAGGTFTISTYSPAFFTASRDGKGQILAANQDGVMNSPAHPAARGSLIKLYGTGQGPLNGIVPDGLAAPPGSAINTVATPTADGTQCLNQQPSVCVAVGSKLAEIKFSGFAPQLVGVWQLTIKVPDGFTGPAIPVRAVIGGANVSNIVSLAIN